MNRLSARFAMDQTLHADGLPPEQRRLAMATVIVGITMAVMDATIANVALPAIAADLNTSASSSIWIINAYQVALAICLLPFAALGEIAGYRRIYLTGLALFSAASLACALSTSLEQIAVARILQGLGAAGIMSVNTALIRFIHPASSFGRAIGFNALVAGTATALGPTVSGIILGVTTWHGIFLINLPLGLFAFWAGLRSLPAVALATRRFDARAALLCMAFVGAALMTMNLAGHASGATAIGASAGASIVLLLALLKLQSREAPMLPTDLLRIPLYSLSIGASFFSFAAMIMAFLCLPFFLQVGTGRSATHAGLLMTAWPVAVALVAPIAGRLSDRIPAGILSGIGSAVMTVGLLCMLGLDRHSTDFDIFWRELMCGVGFSIFQTPNNRTMLSSAPRKRTGAASGMLGTGRLFGQTAGASVSAYALGLATKPFGTLFAIAAGFAACGCVVGLMRWKSKPGN